MIQGRKNCLTVMGDQRAWEACRLSEERFIYVSKLISQEPTPHELPKRSYSLPISSCRCLEHRLPSATSAGLLGGGQANVFMPSKLGLWYSHPVEVGPWEPARIAD